MSNGNKILVCWLFFNFTNNNIVIERGCCLFNLFGVLGNGFDISEEYVFCSGYIKESVLRGCGIVR